MKLNNEICISFLRGSGWLYNHDKEITISERNKAIDDYMNKLCNHCMQQTNECYKLECPFCTDGCDIVSIAEQLKAGGNIELSEHSKSQGNRTGK